MACNFVSKESAQIVVYQKGIRHRTIVMFSFPR